MCESDYPELYKLQTDLDHLKRKTIPDQLQKEIYV